MSQLTLNQLKTGEKAEVIGFDGGYGLISRLNALGIVKGKEITKISNSFLKGPVTVQVGQSKIAIGYGMANKIIVKLVDEK